MDIVTNTELVLVHAVPLEGYNVHLNEIHSNEIARVYSQDFLTDNPELYTQYALICSWLCKPDACGDTFLCSWLFKPDACGDI